MGLKPLVHPHYTNPFTEVNGNRINSSAVLLPPASCPSRRRVADGFYMLLLNRASCPTGQAGSHIYSFIT